MDVLCADVLGVITGFANECDVYALARTNQEWREVVTTSKVFYAGPPNGTLFSKTTFLNNGFVMMPYVQTLNLLGFDNDFPGLEAIKYVGPQNPMMRKRWRPELITNVDLIYPLDVTFSHATLYGEGAVVISAEEVSCKPETFEKGTFKKLTRLIMFTDKSAETVSDRLALEKAFSTPLQSLEIMGILTDENMKHLPVSKTLKKLFLHYQSFCNWDFVRYLQLSCPLIESFGILSSTLIDVDVFKFDWSLWPNLHTLNFDQNYILQNYPPWPSQLKHLSLVQCKSELPLDLISLKIRIPNLSVLKEFIQSQTSLRHLSITFTKYIPPFWIADDFWDYCGDLITLHFEFKETLHPIYLRDLRSKLPTVLINFS
jgi:hypothetical protein